MDKLSAALGAHSAKYEEIALKAVGLVEQSGASAEVGLIALKLAIVILEAEGRDGWDKAWAGIEETTASLAQ